MPQPSAAILGLTLWLSLSMSGPLTAQDGRGIADVAEVVDVHLVNIDLQAMDRQGQPVTDLEVEDLRLFDNGQRTEISHFARTDIGSGVSDRLTLVVFIDDLHLAPADRDASLSALRVFLSRLMTDHQGINTMVVSFDGQLRMLQDLTADYGELARGLSQIELANRPPPSRVRELKRLSQSTVEEALRLLKGQGDQISAGRSALKGAFGQLRLYAQEIHADSSATADALSDLIASLALVPGRKAILYLSGGIAMRPLDQVLEHMDQMLRGSRQYNSQDLMRGPDDGDQLRDPDIQSTGSRGLDRTSEIFGQQQQSQQREDYGFARFSHEISRYELFDRFRALVVQANTNRVTFYPITPPPTVAASAASSDSVADRQSLGQLSDLASSLHFLAESTGGRAMVTGRDIDGFLERAGRELSSYYSVAFQPQDFIEGSRHTVEIKARRRGVQLLYRQSYIAKSLQRRVVERTSGALLLGWAENPHSIVLQRVSQETDVGGFYSVELAVLIPLGKLELVLDQGHYRGQIRVVVTILTEDRKQLEPSHVALPLRIPAVDWEQAEQQFYSVNLHFKLPRGAHKVAAGLWDDNSGTGSFIRQDLTIRPTPPAAG